MKQETIRRIKAWWFWHFEDVLISVLVVVFVAAGVCVIRRVAREARQHRKVRDERTVANTPIDGRFEYVEVDGHEYLLWTGYGRDGITHSPKCKCIQKDAPHEQQAD